MDEARFTMRIHPIIMAKLKVIAKQNGRSINKEIEQILKWVVDDYERTNGRIKLAEDALPAKPKREVEPIQAPADNMESLFKVK